MYPIYPAADCEKTQTPISEPEYQCVREKLRDQGAGQIGRCFSESEILTELFRYHSPTPETLPKFAAINQAAKNFAEVILQNCPSSADRSAAIRLIRDARMTANAAVALNGLSL